MTFEVLEGDMNGAVEVGSGPRHRVAVAPGSLAPRRQVAPPARVGDQRRVHGEDVAVVDEVEGFGRELEVVALLEDRELAGDAGVEVVDAGTGEGVAAGDEVRHASARAGGEGGVGDAGIRGRGCRAAPPVR